MTYELKYCTYFLEVSNFCIITKGSNCKSSFAAEDKIYFFDRGNRMQCCCSESCTDSYGQVVGKKLNCRCYVDDSLTKIFLTIPEASETD